MPEKPAAERHNVNLSRQVWGELKLRAFQEGLSASEMVAYVIEHFAEEAASRYTVTRYQPRSPDEARLGRTVFIPPAIWEQAQTEAARGHISVSALIETALRRYLGLLEDPAPGKVVRVGEERVYLGENPLRIDLRKGKQEEE